MVLVEVEAGAEGEGKRQLLQIRVAIVMNNQEMSSRQSHQMMRGV